MYVLHTQSCHALVLFGFLFFFLLFVVFLFGCTCTLWGFSSDMTDVNGLFVSNCQEKTRPKE